MIFFAFAAKAGAQTEWSTPQRLDGEFKFKSARSPSISSNDSILYIETSGHVYYSTITDTGWTWPARLDAPFNHQPDFVKAMGPFFTGFGGDIAALGDVNGDGVGDFLVSESSGGDITFPEGQAYIFLGDTSLVVSVEPEEVRLPESHLLLRAYPNPFNSTATIEYALGHRGHVSINLYNMLGRKVSTLLDSDRGSGAYSTRLDGTGLSSGIYFARMAVEGRSKTIKILLLK